MAVTAELMKDSFDVGDGLDLSGGTQLWKVSGLTPSNRDLTTVEYATSALPQLGTTHPDYPVAVCDLRRINQIISPTAVFVRVRYRTRSFGGGGTRRGGRSSSFLVPFKMPVLVDIQSAFGIAGLEEVALTGGRPMIRRIERFINPVSNRTVALQDVYDNTRRSFVVGGRAYVLWEHDSFLSTLNEHVLDLHFVASSWVAPIPLGTYPGQILETPALGPMEEYAPNAFQAQINIISANVLYPAGSISWLP